MTDDRPSRTALGVTWVRAAHQWLDHVPCVLDDPAAVGLIGPEGVARIRAEAERAAAPRAGGLRSHVVLRSR